MSSAAPGGPSGPSLADLDHSDLRPNIIAAAWTAWSIALVFVLLRFWTRTRIVHTLGLSDWCILLSLMAAMGYGVSVIEQCTHGTGLHVWDVNFPVDYAPMMEAWWFSLFFYVLTLALTKVSICLLYLTIFTLKWARLATYAVLAVVAITNIWATITTLTYCIPLRSIWDLTVAATYCQDQNAWWANTGLMITTDLMIFCLPIPIVWPLKLPRRQKVVVVGVFTVGFFVCIVSLIRLSILIRAKQSTDPDFTVTGVPLMYWTTIEIHTAIAVACAMTLKPLVARLFPGLLDARSRRYTGGGGGSGMTGPSVAAPGVGGGSGGGGDGRDPPLTIGSRRVRGLAGSEEEGEQQQRGQEQGRQLAGMQEWQRRLRQLGGVGGGDGGVGGIGRDGDGYEKPTGPKPVGDGRESAGKGKEAGVDLVVHGPWAARSDSGSDRTGEELGRKMSTKSMG